MTCRSSQILVSIYWALNTCGKHLSNLLFSSRCCVPRYRCPKCQGSHRRPTRDPIRVWILRGRKAKHAGTTGYSANIHASLQSSLAKVWAVSYITKFRLLNQRYRISSQSPICGRNNYKRRTMQIQSQHICTRKGLPVSFRARKKSQNHY